MYPTILIIPNYVLSFFLNLVFQPRITRHMLWIEQTIQLSDILGASAMRRGHAIRAGNENKFSLGIIGGS